MGYMHIPNLYRPPKRNAGKSVSTVATNMRLRKRAGGAGWTVWRRRRMGGEIDTQDGVVVTMGDRHELTPEKVRAMSPDERAMWEQIFGKPLLDALAESADGPAANGSWTITSISRTDGKVELMRGKR